MSRSSASPVGAGDLDETFHLAFKTEARNASRVLQAGIFLDCSKCYERVPPAQLEQFAIERGFPLYALNAALNMYSGGRRILIQGVVSEAVQSTCGLPLGCGLSISCMPFLCVPCEARGDKLKSAIMWMIWSWLLPDLSLRTVSGIATGMCSKHSLRPTCR
eukprot:3585398-Amphidinium_carterae.2